jgi:hypothetical protein
MADIVRRPAPPLPATVEDMQSKRVVKPTITLNDMVEEVHFRLYPNPDYAALLNAVWDSEAVEGSLAADNYKAADMIREEAKRQGNTVLSTKNWATIAKSLGVVLRRFESDRKTRRQTVHGERVPDGEGNGAQNHAA